MQRVDEQLGEYRLLARLAKGGQSEVFLAARSGPHGFFRPVVIKALPDEFKGERALEALFYQEATISSRFSHPNVITVHDAKRADGEHFMVMDYVAGQTVADFAQRSFSDGRGISVDQALLIAADACRGLHYVHSFEDVDCRQYRIVHCDISPQNLMITYSGTTRVFDFGISQIVGESGAMSTDLVGGKLSYMSPEQCRDEELDVRSDIFSLGIIVYELVAGTRLFRHTGGDDDEVKEAILSSPIDAPSSHRSDLDESIDSMVMRALRREPDERYDSAGEMRRDIENILQQRGVDIQDLRDGLGDCVEENFDRERQAVASTLRSARQRLSEQAFMPEDIDDSVDEPTERELELEEELDEARERIDTLQTSAQRATEVASALSEEVAELQQRQRWYVAGLCVISMVALAVATMAYLSHDEPFVEDDNAVEASANPTAGE